MDLEKLDLLADKLILLLKVLLRGCFGIVKSLIAYAFISGVYLSIYYTQGLEVTLILLACGVVYFGLKVKQENAVIQYELKKMLKEERNNGRLGR